MSFALRLRERMPRNVSAPVVTFVVALLVVAITVVALWRLHLLVPLLASNAFQSTTFVLAVLAIIFGSIQFWDSRRHSAKIEQVARSMSTRYIDSFRRTWTTSLK